MLSLSSTLSLQFYVHSYWQQFDYKNRSQGNNFTAALPETHQLYLHKETELLPCFLCFQTYLLWTGRNSCISEKGVLQEEVLTGQGEQLA